MKRFLILILTLAILTTGAAAASSWSETSAAAAKVLAECVTSDMTDLEKALACHDWIVREVDFDFRESSSPESSRTAYGVLTTRKAVCAGYAEAYSALMTECGIDNITVTSKYLEHEWNLIKIDGEWYHVDCTSDDPITKDRKEATYNTRGGYVSHDFFLLSDEEYKKKMNIPDWPVSHPSGESGAYTGYAFRPDDESNIPMMNRIDGDYYYLQDDEDSPSGQIFVRTNLDGSDRQEWNTEENYQFMFELDGKLYANTNRFVYELDKTGRKIRVVAATEGVIINFWLKNGEFGCWAEESGEVNRRISFDFSDQSYLLEEDGMIYFVRKNGDAVLIFVEPDKTAAIVKSSVQGHPVIGIANKAFMQNRKLTTLRIEEGVRFIDDGAFWNSWLKHIWIPSSVTRIGDEAFLYNYRLKDMFFEGDVPAEWGKNVVTNGKSSSVRIHYAKGRKGWSEPTWTDVTGCTYRTSSFDPDSIKRSDICGDNAYYVIEDGVLTVYGTGEIWNYSYAPFENMPLDKIVIEEGITRLGDCMFMYSRAKTVELPSTLESIGSYAFFNSVDLYYVKIPAGVKKIEDHVFEHCDVLQEVFFEGDVPAEFGKQFVTKSVSSIVFGINPSGKWTEPRWKSPAGNTYSARYEVTEPRTGQIFLHYAGDDPNYYVRVTLFRGEEVVKVVWQQGKNLVFDGLPYGDYRIETAEAGTPNRNYTITLNRPWVEMEVGLKNASDDVNRNGTVSAADLQTLWKLQKMGERNVNLVDLDGDAAFTAADFLRLFRNMTGAELLAK